MMVIMVMSVVMIVMVMTVTMMMVVVILVEPAGTGAEMIAQFAILDIASRCGNALPLDMMVMAFLGKTDFILETKNLRAVLAQRTVHVVVAVENFTNAVGEGGYDLGMVVEIACLDEFHLWMGRGDLVGEAVDTVDQNAGEQKVGKHHNALETKLDDMFKAGLDKREGHAGIADFGPAEAHAFPQHPGNLGNVGICVRVRCTAADDHEAGVRPVDRAVRGVRLVKRLGDTVACRLQHLKIDRKLAAILDGDAMLGGIGIENGRDIVLRMSGGEQHARDGQHMCHALFPKFVQTGFDDRRRKFQIAVFDRPVREQRCQLLGQNGKFGNSGL